MSCSACAQRRQMLAAGRQAKASDLAGAARTVAAAGVQMVRHPPKALAR